MRCILPIALLGFASPLVAAQHGGVWVPTTPPITDPDIDPTGGHGTGSAPGFQGGGDKLWGGGSSGGGSRRPAPSAPTTPGWTAPTGGGALPSGATPATGGYPITAPAQPAPSSGGIGAPATTGTLNVDELTDWSYWWYFNREPLLDLRRRFDEQAKASGAASNQPLPTNRPSDVLLLQSVLPPLFQLSGPNAQDAVRQTAGIALGRIGAPNPQGIRTALESQLGSRDPQVQETALLGLGLTGQYWAIDTLRGVLADEKALRKLTRGKLGDRERAFAAYALGVLGDRAPHDAQRAMVLEPLWALISDTREDREVRVAAANALGLTPIGWTELPSEADAPERDDDAAPATRLALLDALWELYLDERDVFVTAHLAPAMARLAADAPDAVRDMMIGRFIARLEDRPEPRSQDLHGLVIGLGIMGNAWGRASDTAVRAKLYAIASEENDAHARHMALMALAQVVARSGRSLPPAPVQAEFEAFVLAGMKDGRSMDQPWYALAAGVLGAHLKKPVEGRALGELGEPLLAHLRLIVDAAGSPDALAAAVLALGLSEDFKSADTVDRLYGRTRNKHVRGYAALSLGLLAKNGAMAKLELFLDDARYEPTALEHGAIGLALLNRERCLGVLEARLEDAFSGITAAPLAATLGRIGNADTVRALAKIAENRHQTLSTRANAALALGLISRPHALTWRSALACDSNYYAWVPTLYDQAGQGILNIY